MASGMQFAGEVSLGNAEVIYTPGGTVVGVCHVNFCNLGTNTIRVHLGYSASATTSATAYLEYRATVPAGGVLERTKIVLKGTQSLIAEVETASFMYVTCWAVENTL